MTVTVEHLTQAAITLRDALRADAHYDSKGVGANCCYECNKIDRALRTVEEYTIQKCDELVGEQLWRKRI